MKQGIIIAAPSSGQGKTTVARSLMAALVRRGLVVQPFKCGPDYIDTKFHTAVCHRPSVNLDLFMSTPTHLRHLYERYSEGADICVVEGMMGLYDGYRDGEGSTADVARTLGLPIVLVVDARSAAYSVAALLKGFTTFWSELEWAGVVFNRVGSQRHATMLAGAARSAGIACLGFIPKSDAEAIGERYLGLDFSRLGESLGEIALGNSHQSSRDVCLPDKVIAVARDSEAFSFIYQEVIDQLRESGNVVFFNPLHNEPLPEGTSFLYLPGGYPERHLAELEAAQATRESIVAYVGAGGKVVAECGGMIYLSQEVVDDSGSHPMCGLLPVSITARKSDRRLHLGYRRFMLGDVELRGHEFHYTDYLTPPPSAPIAVTDARGKAVTTPIIIKDNVLASYIHFAHLPIF